MTEFHATATESLSVDGTAADLNPPAKVADASGNNQQAIRRVTHVKIVNTHASQIMYLRRDATATTSTYDVVVPAGQSVVTPLGADHTSMIASGASTTGVAHYGRPIS